MAKFNIETWWHNCDVVSTDTEFMIYLSQLHFREIVDFAKSFITEKSIPIYKIEDYDEELKKRGITVEKAEWMWDTRNRVVIRNYFEFKNGKIIFLSNYVLVEEIINRYYCDFINFILDDFGEE